jgi:hypothetical protein
MPMVVLRWRWRPIIGVFILAALIYWALVSLFGSATTGPKSLAAAVSDSSNLQSVPLQFPDVSQPLQEVAAQAVDTPIAPPGSPSVTGVAVQTKTTGAKPAPQSAKSPSTPAAGNGDPSIGPDDTLGTVALTGADRSSDPVAGNLNDGFENPASFGPDEPQAAQPAPEPPPSPAPATSKFDDFATKVNNSGSGDSGTNGANGSSQVAIDAGKSDQGKTN